jgi:hypothetical protein
MGPDLLRLRGGWPTLNTGATNAAGFLARPMIGFGSFRRSSTRGDAMEGATGGKGWAQSRVRIPASRSGFGRRHNGNIITGRARSLLRKGVEAVAGPAPLFRRLHQPAGPRLTPQHARTACHGPWVVVEITQFPRKLLAGKIVEVVESGLSEMSGFRNLCLSAGGPEFFVSITARRT